jgi:coenzyme F420-reducing hydrogenase beta subunit
MDKSAIKIITEDKCTGCFACYNKCPFDAIGMKLDEEGFYKPYIDPIKCTNCGLCAKVCPVIHYQPIAVSNDICYSSFTKNDVVLKESSSGGIFTELAAKILEDNGVVIGVILNDLKAEHIVIDNIIDLHRLRGSKYLPSKVGNIYKKVLELVKTKKVLFSGTPCQVAAMNLFVKSENLITVDIVCHGVPSLTTFEKSIIDRFDEKPSNVRFRDKTNGWVKYNIKYIFDNREIIKNLNKDEWFAGFLKNIFLMKSCYDCKFNLLTRPGDISLGDFWGISKIDIEFYKKNNDRGVSLVILNSEKGKSLFNSIENNIVSREQAISIVQKFNSRINSSKYMGKFAEKRIKFFARSNKINYSKGEFVESYLTILINKIKNKVKKIIRR